MGVKGINPMVLEAIMTYQNVISVSKTTWEKAIKKARKNDEMKEKLLKLVGQLQAHNHSQTKNISIPKEFNVICKQSEATRWEGYYKCWKSMEIFTQEDEELQRLLHIEEKMDNLYVALGFTSYSKYSAI